MKTISTEMPYKPPFTLTKGIMNQIADIAEMTGRIEGTYALQRNPTLRRDNRIRTIYSSLAIEHNSLSLSQATAVLDGKWVLASPKDIHEVKTLMQPMSNWNSSIPVPWKICCVLTVS